MALLPTGPFSCSTQSTVAIVKFSAEIKVSLQPFHHDFSRNLACWSTRFPTAKIFLVLMPWTTSLSTRQSHISRFNYQFFSPDALARHCRSSSIALSCQMLHFTRSCPPYLSTHISAFLKIFIETWPERLNAELDLNQVFSKRYISNLRHEQLQCEYDVWPKHSC